MADRKTMENDLKILFTEKGWRLHHNYMKEGTKESWLSYCLKECPQVPLFKVLSISEEALLEKSNYKILISNSGYRGNLLELYLGQYFCSLTSREIIIYIDKLVTETEDPYIKREFEEVKKIFFFKGQGEYGWSIV